MYRRDRSPHRDNSSNPSVRGEGARAGVSDKYRKHPFRSAQQSSPRKHHDGNRCPYNRACFDRIPDVGYRLSQYHQRSLLPEAVYLCARDRRLSGEPHGMPCTRQVRARHWTSDADGHRRQLTSYRNLPLYPKAALRASPCHRSADHRRGKSCNSDPEWDPEWVRNSAIRDTPH